MRTICNFFSPYYTEVFGCFFHMKGAEAFIFDTTKIIRICVNEYSEGGSYHYDNRVVYLSSFIYIEQRM